MSFMFDEMPDSGAMVEDPPSKTVRYRATGIDDENYVLNYARMFGTAAAVTTPMGILYRQPLRLDPNGWANKIVTVEYKPKKHETGEFSWTFDTTGATVKIKAAKEHIQSYDKDGVYATANLHKGAIGVKGDEVEGADITIGALKISCRFKHPAAVVTMPFVKALRAATGTTNSQPFLDHDAGELLYLGSTGSDGSEAEAEVNYLFASSENVTDLSFGDITNIVKKGHHYAWVEFEETVASGEKSLPPKIVHVERVYNETDFESVFGWS